MTPEERKAAIELKARTVERLQRVRAAMPARYTDAMRATDARMETYVLEVIDNPERHNLYELLQIGRFFDFLDKYEWRAARVRRFIRFYEALRFNGTSGRRRYKLTPVQTFQFAHILGFVDGHGRRLCRTAYIFVPRKFSKTTSAAALAVYDMLFGDSNAQAYVAANSYEQAKICFDEIRAIMRDIDPAEHHFRVNREKITFKDRGRDSLIRCLTSNSRTQDGLHASLVIMDEYAQARNTAGKNGADLKNVLTSSMGPRREPLTLIITTASDVVDGPFVHELEGVKAVLRGEGEADSMYAALFMPDADDAEDDPRTWAKVQPHLGITVQPDFYEREWQTAQLSAENKLAFRTKLLNVFAINERAAWIDYEKAVDLCGDFDIDRVTGRPECAIAFDLSVRDDFSAVTYSIYRNKKHYCHTEYYFPEGCLAGHPNEQLYRAWAEQGHLKLCRGGVIDVRAIAEDILRRSRTLNVLRISYDAWKCRDLVNILATVGGSSALQPYSQTVGNFNLPVEIFEMRAFAEPCGIELNDNPINAWCFSNCVIMEDNLENRKPEKASHWRKIDGAITVLMTLGAMAGIER